MITVYIARFGHDEIELTLEDGTTVSAALQASSIELTGREEAFVDGIKALPSSILDDGDIISVVTPKQGA